MNRGNGSPVGQGCVQVYTGNGKGKTTAAMGLALRAAGAGLRTLIIQFMKGQHYSELESAKLLAPYLRIEQCGSPEFCRPGSETFPEHVRLAGEGLRRARKAVQEGEADVIILDEIVTAALFGLIGESDILELMKLRPHGTELILTGRGAGAALIDAADLVTEMREIKHYFREGIPARRGIES
jgi:cob(I)alamin adenosyltransferase